VAFGEFGDAAEERGDGEESNAGHVVGFAAEDAGEPGRHGEDNGVGDEMEARPSC
jgi:hypothetical protein